MAAGGIPYPTRTKPAAPAAVYNPDMYVSSTYLGGTGARDRLEKLISEGVLVDGKRVKLEAFSRNYAQAFPLPTKTALNLVVDTERTRIIESGDRTFLQVGLQAQKGEAPRRPSLNVALVFDRSGSMNAEGKMEQARAAALRLVEGLHPGDHFSLVAFDSSAEVLVPSQRVGSGAGIRQRVSSLTPGGATNIYDALRLGYTELAKHAARSTVSRLLLLSDGEVTAGVQEPEAFHQLAREAAEAEVQTTAIGLGVEFNEDLMLALAREGKGNYHFIKDGTDAAGVFTKELDELTHLVAKAVRVRIRLADGVGLVRVLGSRKLDAAETADAKADERRIDRRAYEELGITPDRQRQQEEPGIKTLIPAFYRGDNHVLMLELVVPPGRGKRKLADVFLKYKDLVSAANRETRAAAAIEYTPNRHEMIASTRRSVKKNLLGFQTGEALTEAAALIERGRPAEAVRLVDERMVVLGLAAREWGDRDLERDGKLLDRYKTVLAQVHRNPTLARAEFGEYLKKSLSYAGYKMTR